MTHIDIAQPHRPPLQRARSDGQKEARARAILDAAENLFTLQRGVLPTVEQVARAVGVAKGTVYLYFPTKEAIFLALFKRRCEAWWDDVGLQLSANQQPLTAVALASAVVAYPLTNRIVLDLAVHAQPLMNQGSAGEDAGDFHEAVGAKLTQLAEDVSAKLPALDEDTVHQGFLSCFAFLLGLWQVADPGLAAEAPAPGLANGSFDPGGRAP